MILLLESKEDGPNRTSPLSEHHPPTRREKRSRKTDASGQTRNTYHVGRTTAPQAGGEEKLSKAEQRRRRKAAQRRPNKPRKPRLKPKERRSKAQKSRSERSLGVATTPSSHGSILKIAKSSLLRLRVTTPS